MQYFLSLFTDYFKNLDKLTFLLISIFVAVLIFFNYRFGLNSKIWQASTDIEKFLRFYVLYLFTFGGAYLIQYLTGRTPFHFPIPLLILIVFAPAIFALKVIFNAHRPVFFKIFEWPKSRYFFILADYPIRLLLVLIIVWMLWKWIQPAYPFCGLTFQNFEWKPYLILLACMVPLIAFASTRPDFLHTYPKLKTIDFFANTSSYPWATENYCLRSPDCYREGSFPLNKGRVKLKT